MASFSRSPRPLCRSQLVFATLSIVALRLPACAAVNATGMAQDRNSEIPVRYLTTWSRIGAGSCGDDCAASYSNYTTQPATINLLYVKLPKTASTTTAGIARRIARNNGLSNWNGVKLFVDQPSVWSNHMPRNEIDSHPVDLNFPAFVFSMVRHPVSRCLSMYYYQVTRGDQLNTEEAKLNFIKSDECRNYQYEYLRTNDTTFMENDGQSEHEAVKHLLAQYSFIGVVEMYEESLVVLAKLLGVPLTDVLHVPSRVSSSGLKEHSSHNVFVPHPELEDEDPSVIAYMESREWMESNRLDYLLHDASMQMLKQWISATSVESSVHMFKEMEARAAEKCADESTHKWYKKVAHIYQWCYWNDNGCGYPCLDAEFGEKPANNSNLA